MVDHRPAIDSGTEQDPEGICIWFWGPAALQESKERLETGEKIPQ
jgi:hypothetical protein